MSLQCLHFNTQTDRNTGCRGNKWLSMYKFISQKPSRALSSWLRPVSQFTPARGLIRVCHFFMLWKSPTRRAIASLLLLHREAGAPYTHNLQFSAQSRWWVFCCKCARPALFSFPEQMIKASIYMRFARFSQQRHGAKIALSRRGLQLCGRACFKYMRLNQCCLYLPKSWHQILMQNISGF